MDDKHGSKQRFIFFQVLCENVIVNLLHKTKCLSEFPFVLIWFLLLLFCFSSFVVVIGAVLPFTEISSFSAGCAPLSCLSQGAGKHGGKFPELHPQQQGNVRPSFLRRCSLAAREWRSFGARSCDLAQLPTVTEARPPLGPAHLTATPSFQLLHPKGLPQSPAQLLLTGMGKGMSQMSKCAI